MRRPDTSLWLCDWGSRPPGTNDKSFLDSQAAYRETGCHFLSASSLIPVPIYLSTGNNIHQHKTHTLS